MPVPGGQRDEALNCTNALVRASIPLVHPAIHNANLSPVLAGDVVVLPGAHAKVRRSGYRKDET